jgi:hypothetical protein
MRYRLLGLVVLASLVGCGGSDSEDDSPRAGRPPARTQPASERFVRQVDALCRDANPELAAIMTALVKARDAGRAGRVSASRTFGAFAALLRKASATTARLQARLRSITAPRQERAFYRALAGSIQEGASNLRRQVSAAEARDARRLRDLSVAGSVINARGNGLIAGHGGFRFCGRGWRARTRSR